MQKKRALSSLILVLVFAGSAFFIAPQKASAVVSCIPAIAPVPDIPVSVPTQSVGAAIRQNISNTFQASNFTKECILDALVTFLKEALIQNLTGSIVDWINNDFEGGPAFVTDPAGFFVNIADETAGHFIETQLGPIGQLLCSPFDLRLRLNLWLSTSASRKQYIGCRLSEIEQNVTSAFTRGDFIASGGWRTFHAVSADPRNNQYGAFILASDALNTEFIKKTNERLRELSEGRGFLSYKKCIEWSEGPNEGTGEGGAKVCLKYKVETPGSLINNQLNNVFGSELRKFELADEINEIFQALVNFGLRKVFAAGGGLRSVGVRQEINKPRIIADSFSDVQRKANEDTRTNDAFKQGYATSTADNRDSTLTKVNAEAGTKSNTSMAIRKNLAINRPAVQSGEYTNFYVYAADVAVNGTTDGVTSPCHSKYTCVAYTGGSQKVEYWEVALEKTSFIEEIKIHKAADLSYTSALGTFSLIVLDANRQPVLPPKILTPANGSATPLVVPIGKAGNIVRIERSDARLALAEVQVFGTEGETPPAGSGITAPQTGAIPNAPTSISAPSVMANTSGALEAVFTANEDIKDAKVQVTLQIKESGAFKNFAPAQVFETFSAHIKNPDTTKVHFTEILLVKDETPSVAMTNPAPYTLHGGTFSTNKNERVSAGFNFTPTSAGKGKEYQLIVELLDSALKPILGATQALQFSVPN